MSRREIIGARLEIRLGGFLFPYLPGGESDELAPESGEGQEKVSTRLLHGVMALRVRRKIKENEMVDAAM